MNEHIEKKEISLLNTNVGDCVKGVAKLSWVKPVLLFFLLVIVFGLGMSMGRERGYHSERFGGNGQYSQSKCGFSQKGYIRPGFNGYQQMSEIRNQMMRQNGVSGIDTPLDVQ
jgi:hypothetical protein